MQLDNACVQRFAGLFPGRSDVWGAIQGKAVKEPVTLAHYRRHLEGKISLGIYPLTSQGLVRWLAIDVDLPDPLHTLRLLDALSNLGVTKGVYLERSKSKGFHVLFLLSDWVAALEVRRIARSALQEAGLSPTTEVFPKQDRLTRETPWGSYLNLPYFGGDNPEGRRMILDRTTLNPIRLADWLAGVQTFPVDVLWPVIGALPGKPEASFPQERRKTTCPSCFQKLTKQGHVGPHW
jgi:hypothetical protein